MRGSCVIHLGRTTVLSHPHILHLPETASKLLIEFMLAVERIISSNTGTPPPTRPVFPPWGTTANLGKESRQIMSVMSSDDPSGHQEKRSQTRDILVIIAVFQDLGHLFCGGGFEHQLGLSTVLLHPVVVECLKVPLVLRHSRWGKDGFEVVDILVCELCHARIKKKRMVSGVMNCRSISISISFLQKCVALRDTCSDLR